MTGGIAVSGDWPENLSIKSILSKERAADPLCGKEFSVDTELFC